MEIDNDGRNGILQKISKGLKDRKKGEPLRVVYDKDMPSDLLKRIMNRLDIGKTDTVRKADITRTIRTSSVFRTAGAKI